MSRRSRAGSGARGTRALRGWASLALLALGAAGVTACGDAVVGGACADGYEPCGAACVPVGTCGADATTDATTDGTTDATTDGEGDAPVDATTDGSAESGDVGDDVLATDADAVIDGAPGDGASGDGATDAADAAGDGASDASSDAVGDGAPEAATDASDAADACPPPPYSTIAHCGACGNACSGAAPVCKPALADPTTWECRPICDPPTSLCSGKCVDLDIDPLNCGKCGKTCPSGLCNGGKCKGAKPGHVVVIGHDYRGTASTLAVSRVVQNAVFLPSRNPVRVLALETWADPVAIASVKSILDAGATASGRSYARTGAATTAAFKSALVVDDFEVALVYDQPNAPSGALATAGTDLAPALRSFAEAGGVIVVLDGGGGVGQMPQLLTSGGLLGVASEGSATGKAVEVVAPTDAVGFAVLSPYLAPSRSVWFDPTEPPSTSLVTVVRDPGSAKPVVLHKVVNKP